MRSAVDRVVFGATFAAQCEQQEMDETGPNLPMKGTPSPAEAQRVVEASQQLFGRTLAGWACDVLALRRAGLDRPGWRDGEPPNQWTKAA